MLKNNPILKIFNNNLINLPTPSNINYNWNWGSVLGLVLIIQLLTGIFLSMHYCSDTSLAFSSISHITRDVNYGWLLRAAHSNGASLFFMAIYAHMGRGLYYHSFKQTELWMSGVTLLLLLMATAFLGYVLPWGQMSFWGATVITNFFSAIPIIGQDIVLWLWGGFAVGNPTLNRFFSLHFLMPFVITGMVMVHLILLHVKGSSNPLGINTNYDKIKFHPYFSTKDIMFYMVILLIFMVIVMFYTWNLGDPENFIPANSLVTPLHIQPEWYFLFAYAILRAIPSKLGGVIALFMSVLIFYFLPFLWNPKKLITPFSLVRKLIFFSFISVNLLLTWVGACPVEYPYISIGQLLTVLYFSFFITFL
uniref:Cytochrome b n=1 Tax=Lernaea cyprinacea TaxID=342429 RepID=A0A0U1XCH5_9MAXI|nr:cytochrome b [Lernaea cyprinacea]AIQ80151.1 cytochrome b [Lernaea cyprinacea]